MNNVRPIALLALLVLVLALTACQDERKVETPPVVRPVLSIIVTPQTGRDAGFAGTIEPRTQTSHGFLVLGRMIARDVNLGDAVKKGARLAAIDPVALELSVRSAEASLTNAQAQLANATATEGRQRKLLEQGNATPSQFDQAKQVRESAAAAVAQARANLAKAKQTLGYAELHAEFDGVVTAVKAEIGQVVSPGQVVLTLARPDEREAIVDVPDHLAEGLREGDRFDVALHHEPAVRAAGRLREIGPQADPVTRTRRIRIALEAPPAGFRLGTTVSALPEGGVAPRLRLPATGLVERDGRTVVWVVDLNSSKVYPRDVTLAARGESWVELAGGVEPGTRVVIAGVNSLASGQAVRIPEETRR